MYQLTQRQKIMTFSGVIMAMFMAALDQTVISTAMPRIIADLGGFSQYTWVSSAYIIASAVIMPITGRLSDLYGRKLFYLLGMIIFLLSSVACGMSQDMTQMIASRAVKGLGAGIMMATGFTVIADLFPPAQRGNTQDTDLLFSQSPPLSARPWAVILQICFPGSGCFSSIFPSVYW